MKIKNEIRKSILKSMCIGLIGVVSLFIMNFGAKITPKSFIEFIQGRQEIIIKTVENSIIPKYNTSVAYAKELIDLNVVYEKKVDGKIVKTKLYLVTTENGNYFYIQNPKEPIEKIGDRYIVKGTLKRASLDFINDYAYIAYEKIPDIKNPTFLIIDQLDNWKLEGTLVFSVMGIIMLGLFLFYSKLIYSLINIKSSKAYKTLKDYGNPEELMAIIEKEWREANYSDTETKNWYIIKGYYNTLFIPKELVVATYSYRSGKIGNALHLFEYTGEKRGIAVSNSTLEKILFSLCSSIKPLDINNDKIARDFRELRVTAYEVWEAYKKEKNNLFTDIIEGKNSHPLFSFKHKFIKVIEGNERG